MKFEIKHRWTGSVLFEWECDSIRLAVQAAVESKINLSGADLSVADLSGANLRSADLRSADLRSADLSGADLRSANLSGANLSGADLSGADLRSANLSGADLSGANLRSADLRPIKSDFFEVLTHAPREIVGLRLALVEGRVEGSAYEGECACLVGTIAKIRECSYSAIEGLEPDIHRPSEMFFLGIKKGNTPENNQHAALAVGWIDEFVAAAKLVA